MPTQSFALQKNGPKRLRLSWKGMWKDMVITLDGKTVGKVQDPKKLTVGQDFKLSDHSILNVQLVRGFTSTGLKLLRNGQPLPGSSTDPHTRLQTAFLLVYFLGALDLVMGALALIFHPPFLAELGFGIPTIIYGAVFLLLGYLVSRLSYFALLLAIVLLLMDGITGIVLGGSAGGSPGIMAFLARLILIVPLFQAIKPLQALKEQDGK